MGISDKDRKILWARSGNRCALCRRVLVADRTMLDEEAIVGDEAHIAGRSQGGPRHGECDPGMVDRYDNFILLCRVDHKKVDDQPLHYTVSRLKQFKAQHEAWVERALGKVPASIRFHLDSDSAALHAEGVRIDGKAMQAQTGNKLLARLQRRTYRESAVQCGRSRFAGSPPLEVIGHCWRVLGESGSPVEHLVVLQASDDDDRVNAHRLGRFVEPALADALRDGR